MGNLRTSTNRRSRKKRRTEDFSSDSEDSSSSSESEQELKVEEEDNSKEIQDETDGKLDAKEAVEVDVDMGDDEDINDLNMPNHISADITNREAVKLEMKQIEDGYEQNREAFLHSMLKQYGDDVNVFRTEARDFQQNGSKSIVLMAQLLRHTSNVFDASVLDSVAQQ